MAIDPKWAALRKWLREESDYWCNHDPARAAEILYTAKWDNSVGGRVRQIESVLDEMTRLSRQRPKTGAKKR